MTVVTRLYDDFTHAQEAVALLERSGVPSVDMSLVATTADRWRAYHDQDERSDSHLLAIGTMAAGENHEVVSGLLTELSIVAVPGLGPVVAGGWLMAGGAAGSMMGSLMESGVSEAEAHAYAEAVRRGGTLLAVRTQVATHDKIEILLDAMTDHWSEQTNALGANVWPKAGRARLVAAASH
ncbi:hypothetical protein [Methylocella sp. CPCC 101449]|uniref:hypothetical protein n=1 Tax=Methylocella sp. CPCC 101449 TaxID=2987531 RepID=UPI002891DE74|nr:hypothetical protein [Methylocella sp. CPCC 101449]MDT2024313.1 hypothetical protein [Methylocella sp. CPCC 101449]